MATVKSLLVRICTKTNFQTERHGRLEANEAESYAAQRSMGRKYLT